MSTVQFQDRIPCMRSNRLLIGTKNDIGILLTLPGGESNPALPRTLGRLCTALEVTSGCTSRYTTRDLMDVSGYGLSSSPLVVRDRMPVEYNRPRGLYAPYDIPVSRARENTASVYFTLHLGDYIPDPAFNRHLPRRWAHGQGRAPSQCGMHSETSLQEACQALHRTRTGYIIFTEPT